MTKQQAIEEAARTVARILDPDFVGAGDAISPMAWSALVELKKSLQK